MAPKISSLDTLASEVFTKIQAYMPDKKLKKLTQGYDFAKQAHQGQLRKSGEPYMIHPLRTVQILSNFRVDEDTLIAAFLHDVPEDTTITIGQIEKTFGKKIAYLVDGITKLSKVHYREQMEERQIESLKKLFIHSAEDLRVILIKLADRLDNMRTIRFIANEKKRMRIARETLEIYVPIANLLGIGEIRMELEDLCFEHLYPMHFMNLKREVEERMEERNFILDEMMRITEKEFKKQNMEADITGRPKTLYSIYRKLQTKQTLYNIDDLIAIRLIVPTRKNCYDALGIIHRIFKPKTGGFKDYIAVPKPNGYQSIHTTVFGVNSSIVEFQIRTRYMHLEAEYGIAAHYFYKYTDEDELAALMRQRSSWVQRILEIQKDQKDPQNFLKDLKLDIFQDRIFVFSPKGDVVDLPRDATAIDFAYEIHTDIGNHATKVEINGVMSPISTSLATGDTMRVITAPATQPEREWLNFAKTSLAANKIREFLRHESPEKKLEIGKKFLQREFDRIGKNFLSALSAKRIRELAQKLPYKNLDEILKAVGEGSLNPQTILEILYEERDIKLFSGSLLTRKSQKPEFLSRVGIRILGSNEGNQFREILRTVNALKIPIVQFVIDRPWYLHEDRCRIQILVKNYNELSQAFESIEQVEGVKKISRLFFRRTIGFFLYSVATALLWIGHPLLVHLALSNPEYSEALVNLVVYGGIALMVGLVFYLKDVTRKSLPEFEETRYFWPFLYLLNTFALFTIVGELLTFHINFNWFMVMGLIAGVYALLTVSYFYYRKEQYS